MSPGALKKPDAVLSPLRDALHRTQVNLAAHLRGKDEVIELALAALVGSGHLLLEGPPGTGKTSLARAMAQAFGGTFRRVQMTSDLLPSDIVGFLRMKPGSTELEFRRGPIFTHFLLADELNRSSAKTQGALLEAMAEGTVTVDGVTHSLPDPFFVVATQNPLEAHGVYPLAESQLDRFTLQLVVDSPEKKHELEIYQRAPMPGTANDSAAEVAREMPAPSLSVEALRDLRAEVARVHLDPSVAEYCVDLVRATRYVPEVAFGVSVRGGLQLVAAARGLAFIRGRDYVVPNDVRDVAVPALAHRICFVDGTPDSEGRKQFILGILDRVQAPR